MIKYINFSSQLERKEGKLCKVGQLRHLVIITMTSRSFCASQVSEISCHFRSSTDGTPTCLLVVIENFASRTSSSLVQHSVRAYILNFSKFHYAMINFMRYRI